MPQNRICFWKCVGHEVAAVIVAQRQAAGGAGAEVAELVADRHADGLGGLEAGAALGDMPAEQLGVPVLGDAEQPDLAVLHGGDLGGVGRPHHVRRLGDDLPIVGRLRCACGRDAATAGRARASAAAPVCVIPGCRRARAAGPRPCDVPRRSRASGRGRRGSRRAGPRRRRRASVRAAPGSAPARPRPRPPGAPRRTRSAGRSQTWQTRATP